MKSPEGRHLARVEAKRTLADEHRDRKLLRRRRAAVQQIKAMSGEPDSAAAVQVLELFLVSTSSEELRKRASKLQAEQAEILKRLPSANAEREIQEQASRCAALSADGSKTSSRDRYARELDRLDVLRTRAAMRNDAAEVRDRARLEEINKALQQITVEQMVAENLAWSEPAKSSGMVVHSQVYV